MKLLKIYKNTSLILKIVIGLILGAILALIVPQVEWIALLGTLFVGALKAIAPVLVFVLVASSLAQSKEKLGGQFITIIILYLASTILAAITAVVASTLFPITLTQLAEGAGEAAPSGVGEIFKTLLDNIVSNPIASVGSANYLGILFWALIFGIAMRGAADSSKSFMVDCSDAVSNIVRWIIELAPFGIMGLVFNAVSTSGLAIFTDYGRLILLLVGCMLFSALVINPIMVYVCTHKNPYPLVFRCLKESGVTAFFTRSSAANIPVNMKLCAELGLDRNIYSVSIPLGATVNMAGAAVTITVMTMAAANTLDIAVYVPTAILLSITAALSACGVSGVAGGSLLLIPVACSLFGIPNDTAMQVVGVGFIIGVIQDSLETAVNSSSDAVFTAAAEFRYRRLHAKK